MPGALHNTEQYANNRIEADRGRLKARLRPMRGLKRDHTARVIIRGHALMQNIRRGHHELGVDSRPHRRVATAFNELARTILTHVHCIEILHKPVQLNATVPLGLCRR